MTYDTKIIIMFINKLSVFVSHNLACKFTFGVSTVIIIIIHANI